MTQDMHSIIEVDVALAAVSVTGDLNGADVDRRGFESCEFIANIGIESGTLDATNFYELEIEEADDNGSDAAGSYTDVAAADILDDIAGTNTGTFALLNAAGEAPSIHRCAYIGQKRWVRIVINETLSAATIPMSAVAVKGHPRTAPTNNP